MFEKKRYKVKREKDNGFTRVIRNVKESISSRLKKFKVPSMKILIPVAVVLIVIVVLICLGFSSFVPKGYVSDNGYAVPKGSLKKVLNSSTVSDSVDLVGVGLGEVIYSTVLDSHDYYVGEEKKNIDSGYPVFTRSGSVLYFVDDSFNLITESWGWITSYSALYLSDGMTFNADNERADTEDIILVEVDGGFQVAQEAEVYASGKTHTIPMNSICAFELENITYYAYESDVLVGRTIATSDISSIKIGDKTFNYLDFLIKLGLWEEDIETRTTEATDTSATEPKTTREKQTKDGNAPSTTSDGSETKTSEVQTGVTEPETWTRATEETTSEPETKEPDPPTPPEYNVPEVKFSEKIDSWIYTLTFEATIVDKSSAIQNGVQIYAYEVDSSGKVSENASLRKAIGRKSGTVILSPLQPGKTYKIVAKYQYKTKLGNYQNVTIDVGKATTLAFSEANKIEFSLRDETENISQIKEEDKVEIFSNSLQARDIVLKRISNGKVTEVGKGDKIGDLDPYKEETYISVISLIAKDKETGEEKTLKLDYNAVRLLIGGYTLSHWESAEVLKENSKYEYRVEMNDRYGNTFTITPDDTHQAHTCAVKPYVKITVPAETNAIGATRINIMFNNPDEVTISEGTLKDGTKVTTSMYIVKYGDELIPENAIQLKAYKTADETKTITDAKFLEIHHDGKIDDSSWTITNLDSSGTYVAIVVCGQYDIGDEKIHTNENLKETLTFISGNIASLGTVPFTNKAEEIDSSSALLNIKVMFNKAETYFKHSLIPMTTRLLLTINEEDTEKVQTIELKAAELKKIAIPRDYTLENGVYYAGTNMPAYMDGSTISRMVPVKLRWVTIPTLDDHAADNLWEFLLYSSVTATTEECYFSLDLGSELPIQAGDEETPHLMTLKSSTHYTGTVQIFASIGGETEYDVTSRISRAIDFTTTRKDAEIEIENAFISSDFVEIYGIKFNDPDKCIIEDKADRGGDNLLLQVFDENREQVYSQYLCSDKPYDTIRIEGLEYEKTYTMTIKALQYRNINENNKEVIYTNFDLDYKDPQDPLNPKVYTFTTGESVNGEITLEGVNYFYEDGTKSVSLITEDDCYQYMHQYYANAYTDEAGLEKYKAESAEMESDLYDKDPQIWEKITGENCGNYLVDKDTASVPSGLGSLYKTSASKSRYNYETGANSWILSSWTSRFIYVQPGQEYSVYNISDTDYYNITFFFVSDDGELRYASWYWSYEMYYRGGVFKVPTTKYVYKNKQYSIKYMRISGYTSRTNRGIIVQQYDSGLTEKLEKKNLFNDQVETVNNQYIYYWGGGINKGFSESYNYTKTYIPVTGGSIYEIKGLDNQLPTTDSAKTGGSTSKITVAFYNSAHRYISTYYVSGQTGLIKAPSGAAYIRVNITRKIDGTIDRTMISIKEYSAVNDSEYMADIGVKLSDNSDSQILQGGTYILYMYNVKHSISNDEDLSALPEEDWEEMSSRTRTFEVEEIAGTKLNINEIYNYGHIPKNSGYRFILKIKPKGWSREITIGTIYFNTIRTVKTISTREEFLAIRNDPAENYIVIADLDITNWNSFLTDSDRPFTGSIDFQGHSVIWRSFYHIFYTLGAGASFRNGEITIMPKAATDVNVFNYYTSLFRVNYGKVENIVLHYGPERDGAINEFNDIGAICYTNYGTIDGFVVGLMRDISVNQNFGLICRNNYGSITNGYVYGETITTDKGETRNARLVHNYGIGKSDEITNTYGNNTQYVSCGVGYNTTRGTMSSIYILTDVMVCSESGLADSDGSYDGGKTKDTSVTNMSYASVLCSNNCGQIDDCFTYGDRIDYGYTKNYIDGAWTYGGDGYKTVIAKRGPAVTVSGQLNHAENVTYFSPSGTKYTNTVSEILQKQNLYGATDSLWDYQWYEERLGADGERFDIRNCVEGDTGYFPHLILPNTFKSTAQPWIMIPGTRTSTIELRNSEVRQQGIRSAVITLTFSYRNKSVPIKEVEIVDRNGNPLTTEVFAQRAVDSNYRVDVLVSMNENSGAYSSYSLTSVSTNARKYTVSDGLSTNSGEATIEIGFFNEIASEDDWKKFIVKGNESIYENYLLTNNLDFSESMSWEDWYTKKLIFGIIDGGIYEKNNQDIVSEAGEKLVDSEGNVRQIEVRGELKGMHEISGIGNYNQYNNLTPYRSAENNVIISKLYGTLQNLVFSNIYYNVKDEDISEKGISNVDSYMYKTYTGVIGSTYSGSVIDNVHVRDSYFRAVNYVGGLIAYAQGGTVLNSSVKDCVIETYRRENTYPTSYTGGLAGILGNTLVKGCFVADTYVNNFDAFATNGTGGIAGKLTNSVVDTCYTTGYVYSVYDYVGGIAGYMEGEGSAVTNCYSNMNVTTYYDFAGSIVGYHGSGAIYGNFGTGNVVSKASGTSNVHRICSNKDHNSSTRYDNFAYAEQYLTYVDEEGRYHYGTWNNDDGASRLISYTDTKLAGTWTEGIGIYLGYDIEGEADANNDAPKGGRSVSGGTHQTSVTDGYLPKLVNENTGMLLFDQPDSSLITVSDTFMNIYDIQVSEEEDKEIIDVKMAIFNTKGMTKDEADAIKDPDIVARWKELDITGATFVEGSLNIIGSYSDSSVWDGWGVAVNFQMNYGDQAGDKGHYYDYYLMTLPVYKLKKSTTGEWEQTGVETNSQSITPMSITYKKIGSVNEWNEFFRKPKYKTTLENIMITNDIYIDKDSVTNVIINRLTSYFDSVEQKIFKISMAGWNEDESISNKITINYGTFISRVATSLSNVNFENIRIKSTITTNNTRKGIIGQVSGEVKNVNITNVTFESTVNNNRVGFFGQSSANISNVIVNNMTIKMDNANRSDYVGCVVGYMNRGLVSNVQVYNSTVNVRNARFSGGFAGFFDGDVGYKENDQGLLVDIPGIYVNNTTVKGINYVGGAFGQIGSNCSYIRNVYVGYYTDDINGTIGSARTGRTDSSNPGVLLDEDTGELSPSVVVTNKGGTNTSVGYNYYGGIIGYGNFYIGNIGNCYVYNTLVAACDGTASYVGGIEGAESPNINNSTVENCTVYGSSKYIGGIEGYRLEGGGNTSKENVVYSTRKNASETTCVGGICGYTYERQTHQNLTQHCIVYGRNSAGGVFGYTYYPYYENGSLDTLVFGENNVGGMSGYSTAYYWYGSNYVTASETPLVTNVTKNMFPNLDDAGLKTIIPNLSSESYVGASVNGTTNVGGLIGTNTGFPYNCYVSGNITVNGVENVGGLVGNFYGWTNAYYTTTARRMYNCSCGADVYGVNNVGGLIGYYNRSNQQKNETADKPPVSTANYPSPSYFYGLLFTGNVHGNTNTDFLIGGFRDIWGKGLKADNIGSTMFANSRIYSESQRWVGSTVTYAKQIEGIITYESVAANSSGFAKILCATAESISKPEFYWSKDNAYGGGGLGWSNANWNDESCVRLYTSSTDGASDFATFEAGITESAGAPVVWFDGKNNTGYGYTDTESATWKNLGSGGSTYDATLYWKGVTQDSWTSLTSSQVKNNMVWKNGGLSFISRDLAVADKYRAKLNNSISSILNSRNFTVEITFTPTKDIWIPSLIARNTFSWRTLLAYNYVEGTIEEKDGAGYFMAAVGKSKDSSDNLFFQNGLKSVSAKVSNSAPLNNKTVTYVVENNKLTTYVNGVKSSTTSFAGVADFPELAEWFIGSNTARYYDSSAGFVKTGSTIYNGYMNYSSVRIYNKSLTDAQVQNNAAYDQWYYYEGSKPEGATAVTGDASMWNGTYQLCRSDDGSYGGVVVAENWSNGTSFGNLGQGYYYLTDGEGHNSTIVEQTGHTYGMTLKVYYDNLLGEAKYGEIGYTILRGQEGEDADGNLYNTEDKLYEGGNKIPNAAPIARGNREVVVSLNSLTVANMNIALPDVTAYASGADTINIELSGDIPSGLHYCIWSNDDIVLDTEWPSGERTVTLNYDYASDFIVEVYTAENVANQFYFYANKVRKSVMTYGESYWYLYEGNCLDSKNESIGTAVNLYDGLMLSPEGVIANVEDGSVVGTAGTSFTVTDTRPLWSGTIALGEGTAHVESFGSYLVSDGGIKDVQLVVKNGVAYTLPASSIAGSYIVDTYNDSIYTTVLNVAGSLVDQGDSLVYPEGFGNASIRETSNNLNYSGQMILVRYKSGKLVAFNYMTGETTEVLSDESEAESLWDFIKDSIGLGDGKDNTNSSSNGGHARNAKNYEQDLERSPSADTARDRLKKQEIVNGGDDSMGDGGSDITDDIGGTATGDNAGEAPSEDPSGTIFDEEDGAGSGDGGGTAMNDGKTGGGQEIGEVLAVDTRFVTYYDKGNTNKVYDLEELLTKSEDKLVSENDRAEILAQEGFVTSLSNKSVVVAATERSGLLMVILICCGVIVLAGCMVIILKKYKLGK